MQRLTDTRVRATLQVFWVIVVALISLPAPARPVDFVNDPADASWVLTLSFAAHNHFQWGTEIIWTYGPLGFLDYPVPFITATYAAAVATGVILHFALIALVASLLRGWRCPVWVWVFVAAVFVVPYLVLPADTTCLVIGALLLLKSMQRAHRGIAWASLYAVTAAAIIALACLIKGTAMVSGLGVLIIFFIFTIRRAAPVVVTALAAFIGAFLLLWLVAGQSPGNLPAYLVTNYHLATGYSAAMGLETPAGEIALSPLWGAAFLLSLVGAGIFFWKRGLRPGIELVLLLLPIAAVSFKDGFVRADELHEGQFISVVACISAVFIARVATREFAGLLKFLVPPGVIAALLSAVFLLAGFNGVMPITRFGTTAAQYGSAWALATSQDSDYITPSAIEAQAQAAYQLPAGLTQALQGKSVDILPWDNAITFAYQLEWDPSPVPQGYGAYTSYLDSRDAQHLSAGDAPDYVLVVNESVDGRYFAFDEPFVIQALLQHYDFVGLTKPLGAAASQYLIFQHSDHGILAEAEPETRTKVCASLGSTISVPQYPGQLTFASMSLGYSPLGFISNLVYRPGTVSIELMVHGAATMWTQPYRLTLGTAQDGLFLSSFVGDSAAMASAFNGDLRQPIDAIRISSTGPGDYQSDLCVSFFTLPRR